MTDDDIEKIEKVWNSLGFAFGLTHDRLLFAQALLDAAAPAADTELQPYLRQYRHNDGSDGFVFGYEKEGVDRVVTTLRAQSVAAATPVVVPAVYVATLKSRQQIKAEIPREAQGWWADVCPGETLELRDATAADIARCYITEGQSLDPADYLCELPARGALVARIAIASIKPA